MGPKEELRRTRWLRGRAVERFHRWQRQWPTTTMGCSRGEELGAFIAGRARRGGNCPSQDGRHGRGMATGAARCVSKHRPMSKLLHVSSPRRIVSLARIFGPTVTSMYHCAATSVLIYFEVLK